MEDRHDNGQKKKPNIDFEALGMEIDKEIDSLFVPAEETPDIPEGRVEPSETAGATQPPPAPETAGRDRTALEGTIDFPPLLSEAPPKKTGAAALELEPVPEMVPSQLSVAPESPWERDFSTPFSEEPKPQYASRSELPRVVESFNAAFLSLEWEFSQENIRKLESALANLEPFSSNAKGAAAIFKILKVMLSRLSAKPQSATRRVFELVRDSQGLLAHILLMEGAPGTNEKDRINALITRFRDMRERAIAARDAKSHQIVRPTEIEQPELTISLGEEKHEAEPEISIPEFPSDFTDSGELAASMDAVFATPASASTPVSGKMPDRWSLLELRTWMQSAAHLLNDTVKGIDAEMDRIHQLELVFGKNPALTPVMLKLAGIRGGIENRVASLREQQNGWLSRVMWVENLERVSAVYSQEKQNSHESASQPVSLEEFEEDTPSDEQQLREDVYVFQYTRQPFAVRASDLVTFKKMSRGKLVQFMRKGYATLSEVKSFFRSIRHDLHGQWASAPQKDLKNARFELIGPDVFDATEAPSEPKIAIFVSNGHANGIILADSDEIMIHKDTEITLDECSCHAALGTARTQSGIAAEVLDLDRVFPEN
ncbi:MAG: hypothetical protein ABFD97_01840 [Syntrophobacter sp.]